LLGLGWLAGCATEQGYRCPTCGCAFNGGYSTTDGKDVRAVYLAARKDDTRRVLSSEPAPKTAAPAPASVAALTVSSDPPVEALKRVSTAPEKLMRVPPLQGEPAPVAQKEETTVPTPVVPPPVIAKVEPVLPPTVLEMKEAAAPPMVPAVKEFSPLPPAIAAKEPATLAPSVTQEPQTSKAKVEVPVELAPAKAAPVTTAPAEASKVLTGELQQWRKNWRLRYAGVDAEDAYGGSVQLEGLADPGRLREGQRVRVRGELIPPQTRQQPARFVVQGIEFLD
jgi:hypothetical protein